MSLAGTRFEKLENSIKNEIKRKRNSFLGNEEEAKPAPKKVKTQAPAKENTTKAVSASKVPPVSSKPTKSPKPQNSAPAVENEYVNSRRIYVQGLPFEAEESQIREFFADVGQIVTLQLPRWNDSGRLKGYAHIEFATKEEADGALEKSGQYLGDRYLTIERPITPRALSSDAVKDPSVKPAGCRTIFIKNLPYEATEEELRKHFMVYGPIMNVRLAVWQHTGKAKGIGYIDFKREDSAEIAVKKSGSIVLNGRRTQVDYETSKPKGSFKNNTSDDKKKKA